MGILSESAQGELQAVLAAGLENISNRQQVIFQQYSKSVSPIDGYVFWVATGTIIIANGSLHQITETIQEEDNTFAKNGIVFTSTEEIEAFNTINPTTIYVGAWEVDGVSLQVVFNDTGMVYNRSGLWHYSGDTVYPALQSQLIQSISDLPVGPIVSNSLPIWLAQNSFAPVYPSYLVPDNIAPPYIVVHIDPDTTEAIGAFPILQYPVSASAIGEFAIGQSPIGVTLPAGPLLASASQLMRDNVKLTLYGFNSQKAVQYLASLIDFSLNTDSFGFMNSPAVRDEKRKQSEITAIAMKKSINIVASYYLDTADAIARNLIVSASISFTTNPT